MIRKALGVTELRSGSETLEAAGSEVYLFVCVCVKRRARGVTEV